MSVTHDLMFLDRFHLQKITRRNACPIARAIGAPIFKAIGVAEKEGFEPPAPFRVRLISNQLL